MNRRHLRPSIFRLVVVLLLAFASTAAFARDSFENVVPTGDQTLPFTEIDRLFLDGRYRDAYIRLTEHVHSSKTVSAAQLHNLGLLETLLGIGHGLKWFRIAYQHEPENEHTTWSYGSALLNADSLDTAESALRKAVDHDSHFNEAAIDLARCLRLKGRLDEAQHLMESMTGRDRSDGDAFAELAKIHLARGGYEGVEDALNVLEEGAAEFFFEPVLWEWIQLLVKREDNDEAIRVGTLYLDQYPKTGRAKEVAAVLREIDPDGHHSAGNDYEHDIYREGKPFIDPDRVLHLGEKLSWKAKYGLIGVGDLSAETAKGSYRGEPCYIARYTAKSTVPFVTIADTFYAWIDKDLRFTHRLDMVYHESSLKSRKTLENNYERGISEIRVWEPSGYWWFDSLPLPPSLFDATSQIWFSQQLAAAGMNGECNVSIDHTYEHTLVHADGPDGELKLLDEVMPVARVSGILPYSGMAGLTGEYTGWYTADDQALPAKAKFKIFIGSITILLDDRQVSDFGMEVMESPETNRPLEAIVYPPGTMDDPGGSQARIEAPLSP